MKKHISMRNVIRFMAVAIVAAVTLTACDPERDNQKVTFNSSLEQFTSDSKVVLLREQWIYWEDGDEIDIISDQSGNEKALGTLVNMGPNEHPDPSVGELIEDLDYDADFNGVFVTYLPWTSKYFVGLHPHSDANVLSGTAGDAKGFTAKVNLPAVQTYRDDYSFNKQMFPMVAWYGGSWSEGTDNNPFNLDFKSLAGLVRLQFFNSGSSAVTINTITVNADQPVSGLFNVEALYTDNPYLSDAGGSNTVTLDCNGLSVGAGEVKSLYLVMPAKTGETGTTTYNVTLNVGNKSAHTTMKVRRNGITYMPALDLAKDFTSSDCVGLVGNGTADRPFKIYRDADMEYLRSCFASTPVKVNGVAVTNDTYFHIMRSDIVLPPDTWTGINNFTGKMYYMAEGGSAQLQGITNNSGKPIFNSIANGAVVEGVNVKCGGTISGSSDFSPFCGTNMGTIKNCNIYSTSATTPIVYGGNFAGICLTNVGTLEGCGNNANMTINGNIGGVCYSNTYSGTIIGCYAASPMKVNNPTATDNTYQVGGIAHTNSGTIKDSYFAARVVNSNMAWGGIAYTNSGTIQHCYCGKNATIRTVELESAQNVGGIVNTMTGGTVDYCWTDATLQGGSYVGGIVATMTNGLVKRCFCHDASMIVTALYANAKVGGIVGHLNTNASGTATANIQDCFVDVNEVRAANSNAKVGGVVGHYQSGRIERAYSHESAKATKFYGSIQNESSAVATNFSACYVVDGTAQGPITNASTSDNDQIRSMTTALGSAWIRTNENDGTVLPVLAPYTPSKRR